MKKRNWMPMLALAAPMLLWAQPDTAYGEPGVPRLTNLPPQRVLAIEAQGDALEAGTILMQRMEATISRRAALVVSA